MQLCITASYWQSVLVQGSTQNRPVPAPQWQTAEHEGETLIVVMQLPVVFRHCHATLMKIDFPCPSPVQHAVETSTICKGHSTETVTAGLRRETWKTKPRSLVCLSEYNSNFHYISSVFCGIQQNYAANLPWRIKCNMRNYLAHSDIVENATHFFRMQSANSTRLKF